MTSELFDEFLRGFEREMIKRGRVHVLLLLDNFSGHVVPYVPKVVEVDFFEPNMTSHVQPNDAGIIRCLKANYRKKLCSRAVDRDEEGAENIFDINLLDAMLLLNESWDEVSVETIKNCWRHTGILPSHSSSPPKRTEPQPTTTRDKAWDVLRNFALSSEMKLPEAEEKVQEIMGNDYSEEEWRPTFKAVMDAENDVDVAVKAIENLASASHSKSAAPSLPPPSRPQQLVHAEKELVETMQDLRSQKRLFFSDKQLNLDVVLDPISEQEIGKEEFTYEGTEREVEEKIAEKVKLDLAIQNGEVQVIEEDDEDDDDVAPVLPTDAEIINMCNILATVTIQKADTSNMADALLLSKLLRKLKLRTQREMGNGLKQMTLDCFVR